MKQDNGSNLLVVCRWICIVQILMQIEKNKLLLKSGIDDVIFDDDIDKVEKFEEE